jgi:hypothetical protein
MDPLDSSNRLERASQIKLAAEAILMIRHTALRPHRPLVARLGAFTIDLVTPFNRPQRATPVPGAVREVPRTRLGCPIQPYELTIWLVNRVLCLTWADPRDIRIIHFNRGEWEDQLIHMAIREIRDHAARIGAADANPFRPEIWTPYP